MNFAPAHLKARYVTAGSEFKAFVRMLIQNSVKRSKLAFSSPLIINIFPFLLGSRGKCIFCDRGPRREQEFPLSTRSSRGLNETEVSAEEAIFHFGLSSLSSRDWNDPKVQRDRMEKREILKRSNFLPRVICSQRKKAGLNIVEIGILSFSPPLFSTYSYSKEGKKSLVQPWNHLFQLVRLSILKVLTMSTYQYFSLFHCLDFTLRYIDQFDVRRGIFVWSNVILYLQSWNDEN